MIKIGLKEDPNDSFYKVSDKIFIIDLDKNKKKNSKKLNVVLKAREELRSKGMLNPDNYAKLQPKVKRLNPIISQIAGLKALQPLDD